MADDSDSGRDSLGDLARLAAVIGLNVVEEPVKNYLREKAVALVADHDPNDLHNMISLDVNIVEKHIPPAVRGTLKKYGEDLEPHIRDYVTADQILRWLEDPEEWLPEDADDDVVEEIRAAYEVIEGHKEGRRWLEEQVQTVYRIAQLTDDE